MAEAPTTPTTTPAEPEPMTGRTAWTRSMQTPLRQFLTTETGGAAVLLVAVIAGLVWANVGGSYEPFWNHTLSIMLDDSGIELSLREWVNSGLMTLFFFVVGLEARREIDLGELRERRRSVLPVLSTAGGMVFAV